MEPDASPPADCPDNRRRQDRQRDEILRAVEQQLLHRAADLAHEHLVEFTDDHVVRSRVLAALSSSPDHRLRRRAGEFLVSDPRDSLGD